MSTEGRAQDLLQKLGRLDVEELSAEERAAQIARMAPVVQATLLRARSAKRARRWAWAGSALAVAAAAAVFVLVGPLASARHAPRSAMLAASGVVSVLRSGTERSEVGRSGMVLEADAELRTLDASSAEVELPSGAVLTVAASTQVRLPEDARATSAERLALLAGGISLRVPHLAPGHTLSVVTPDATVTVRGTRFSVSVTPTAAAAITSVVVEEGRVEVNAHGRSVFLARGERWSSAPAAAPEAPPSAAPAAAAAAPEQLAPAVITAPALGREPGQGRSAAERSSLAAENELFERALGKARSGQRETALSDLERFEREHPRSPLIQAVRVEHFRLLRDSGQLARAAAEARRYLSDYPNGFARDDARRVALYGVESAP